MQSPQPQRAKPDGHVWLLGADGEFYSSATKGTFGGNRRNPKDLIYGRLDCSAARDALASGGPYARYRVFFADELAALDAGYRPCWRCLPDLYAEWKRDKDGFAAKRRAHLTG